jgi:hypothetical protein
MKVVHMNLSSEELDELSNGEVLNKHVGELFIQVHHTSNIIEKKSETCEIEGCESVATCFIYTDKGIGSFCFEHYQKTKWE